MLKNNLTMRPYTVLDVLQIADILAIIAKDQGGLKSLLSVSTNSETESTEQTGFDIVVYLLNNAYTTCRDSLIKWFASLYNVTVDEYLSQPPEMLIETINEIATRPESKSFFTKASQAFRTMFG